MAIRKQPYVRQHNTFWNSQSISTRKKIMVLSKLYCIPSAFTDSMTTYSEANNQPELLFICKYVYKIYT